MVRTYKTKDQVLYQGQKLFLQEFFSLDELKTWKVKRLHKELQDCGYIIHLQRFCTLRREILYELGSE